QLSLPSCPLSAARRDPHSFPTRRSSDLNHTSWRWVPALVRVPPGHRDATSVSRSADRRRRPRTHRADRGPCLRPHDSSRGNGPRSEEHTSELQSRFDLVCRLLLEKKNKL